MALIDLRDAWPEELEEVLVLTRQRVFRLSFWRRVPRGREWLDGLDVVAWSELPRISSRVDEQLEHKN